MEPLNVAIVSRSEHARLEAARAFDAAPSSWSVQLYDHAPEGADVVVYGPDVGASGGIVFDPARPEEILREVARSRETRHGARTIVVTSASGGTGATTVALHLTARWAHKGACYLDLDQRWGSSARLGLSEGDFVGWDPADLTGDSIQRRAVRIDAGFRVLLSPGRGGDVDARALVAATASQFEHVVVDAPWSSSTAAVVEASDAGVLVMPPTPSGAMRARSLLDELPGVDLAVVVNRTGKGGELTRAQLRALLGRSLSLELPASPALRDAEDDSRLLTSGWSRWCRRVALLARALEVV